MSELAKITAVALECKPRRVVTLTRPARHHHVLRLAREMGIDCRRSSGCVQGFSTHGYKFLDRREAMVRAIATGQVVEGETIHPTELFSEDLW